MFSLFIATIDTILFSGQARGVVCPGSDGELTILAHHTPLVTTLKGGVVRVLFVQWRRGNISGRERYIGSGRQ